MFHIVSKILIYSISFFPFLNLWAQEKIVWDDTHSKYWPAEAKIVSITSSKDQTEQQAYFYKATTSAPRPLIVSLHTWSGNFQQKDTLVNYCIQRGYHYVHPDFRGPNQTPQALGSELVSSDIDDAITYSLQNASVDLNNIHVIGVSGGGHATVLTYMKSKHAIRSFTAYVGIYDLIDWYHESMGRKNKYGYDILAATSRESKILNIAEAKKRSPFYMDTPIEQRKYSKLNLYVGVHDGYTGSVPITHTLKMYNKVVKDLKPDAKAELIPEEYIQTMVKERSLPGYKSPGNYMERKIIYQNNYNHLVHVTVFEGTHEMPKTGDPLQHVPSKQILAIGDSNGATSGGWVEQLQALRPQDVVINTCVSGNTIGFDNMGRQELNTLKNIERYIKISAGKLDKIVVMLGTNDSKAIFKNKETEVAQNLETLISKIKSIVAAEPTLDNPTIYIVSPPPFAPDSQLDSKYHGGANRVIMLGDLFERSAKKMNVQYINIHRQLQTIFPYISNDGVHLTQEGQAILAKMIQEKLAL